jgi:hypothetical protein
LCIFLKKDPKMMLLNYVRARATGSVSLLVDQISNLLDLKEVIIDTIKIIDPRLARTNNILRSIDRF